MYEQGRSQAWDWREGGLSPPILSPTNQMTPINHVRFWKMWRSKFAVKKSQPVTINAKNCNVEIANEFADFFSHACTCNSERQNVELKNSFDNLKKT